MNNDIRYTMLVLEGLEINHRMDSEVLDMIRGLVVESSQLDEGVLDTIKDKAAAFADRVKGSAKNILPSITQKFDNVLAQVRAKQGDEAADAIESEMNKKGGSNWKNNSVKIAAALAVASSLAQATPAQARDMYVRMSPFQYQQMQMQNQANWSRHRAMWGQDQGYQRQMQHGYPQGYYQQNQGGGNDAAALAIGVMIGAALGAALSQPHK
jgi:hypothetical protein